MSLTQIEALQATLAGEHAATYVLAVCGAQTSRSQEPSLAGDLDDAHALHRTQRDRLIAMIRGAGAQPEAAQPSYALPNEVSGTAQVRAAAVQVEQRCGDLYGQLVESASGSARAWAITALTSSALRVLSFGATAEPFWGMTGEPIQ